MLHKHLNFVVLDSKSMKYALLKDVIGTLACRTCQCCGAKLAAALMEMCTSCGGGNMVFLGNKMAVQLDEPPGQLQQQRQASLIAVQPSALQ